VISARPVLTSDDPARSSDMRYLLVVILSSIALLVVLAGCIKKGGDAIVMGKEHIESVPIIESEVEPEEGATPATPVAPTTPAAPRMTDERWVVSVRMEADQRWLDVNVSKTHWAKLKEGDRVKVTYREGKYTGTAWAAEIR
jgi:hypothetical protein